MALAAIVLFHSIVYAQPLDRVVAIVNDQVITLSQLNTAVSLAKDQARVNRMPLPSDNVLRKKILDQMIDKNLELQLAKKNNITVSPAQIDKAIASIAAQNKMSVSQLYKAVAQQGLSEREYKQQIRDQLLISQLQRQVVGNSITVTEQEVKSFAKKNPVTNNTTAQYHVIDILIPANTSSSAAAMQKAQSLLKTLYSNTNVQQALKQAGAQPQDLGWRPLSQLPDIFANQITHMRVGEFSQPIQAPNGIHILKLESQQGGAQKISDEEIRNIIFGQKAEAQIQKWLKGLRSSSYIKIML